MANVRKLMRLAREFEADEGRDLRGFIDAVAERDLIQAREGEAPLEAEALDAVRLMTIHRAKGLEFPVVCVADLGKDGREDDGRAAHLRRRQRRPAARRRSAAARWTARSSTEIKAQAKRAGEEEERRIFYVAATRAQEHLVLSGATDLEKRPEPAELTRADALDLARLLRRAARPTAPTGTCHDEYEGREVAVRWTLCTPATVDEVLPPADRAPVAPVTEEAPAFEQPLLELGRCRRRARCRSAG